MAECSCLFIQIEQWPLFIYRRHHDSLPWSGYNGGSSASHFLWNVGRSLHCINHHLVIFIAA